MKTKMSGLQIGNKVLGEQVVEHAEFDDITVLGTLQAAHCSYGNLKILGDAKLQECKVKDVVVNGELKATHCSFENGKVMGEMRLDHSSCRDLVVFGELHGSDIQCHILRYGGDALPFKYMGKSIQVPQVRGTTLETFMRVELDGAQSFDAIVNAGKLICHDELACEYFFNFKDIQMEALNAGLCYINPFHDIRIKAIYGCLVIIDPTFDQTWMEPVETDQSSKSFFQNNATSNVTIDTIEADEVILDHVHVHRVCADRVRIGPHGRADHVEYRSACEIHEQAKVGKVHQEADTAKGAKV